MNTIVKLIATRIVQAILRRYPGAEFALAFSVGVIHDLWKEWRKFRSQLKTKGQAPEELAAKRMEVCKNCPIYFAPLKTCGSPLRKEADGEKPLGCFCHMPTKAATISNCWYYDNSNGDTQSGIGWPEELNSTPVKHG